MSRHISFAKLPGYDFTDARQSENWYDSRSAASEPLVSEEQQRLDKNGRGKLSLRLKKEDFQTAQDIMVTAEVQDETHQTIAANVAIPAHHAGVYFGIDRGSPIGEANGARDDQGRVRRSEGEPHRRRRHLQGGSPRLDAAPGRRGAIGAATAARKRDGEVMRQTIAVAADAPANVRFTPPGPGEYELIVEGKDGAGNATAAATYLYSWGDGEGSGRRTTTSGST